jgi:hypothetical protein
VTQRNQQKQSYRWAKWVYSCRVSIKMRQKPPVRIN